MFINIIQNITFNKIIKRGFPENINDFFKVPEKVFKSRKKQLNKVKQKLIMNNTSQKQLLLTVCIILIKK